jgi:Zn finger protein HypA/HybF involved in hydrogenase expression
MSESKTYVCEDCGNKIRVTAAHELTFRQIEVEHECFSPTEVDW